MSAVIDRAAVIAAARPQLEALQGETRDLLRLLRRWAGPAMLIPFPFVALGVVSGGVAIGAVAWFLLAGATLAVMVLRGVSRALALRARVMAAAAPALGLSYAPRPSRPIDLSGFAGTYFGSQFERAQAEDVLSGRRGAVAFDMFDVFVRVGPRAGEGGGRPPPAWLRGLILGQTRVVRISSPGRWTARTVVVRDHGAANRLVRPAGMERVRLVDPRFEEAFEVFSTDQTEARAAMHPVFMERLLSLEALFAPDDEDAAPAVGVFSDGHFLLAFPVSALWSSPQKGLREADVTLDWLVDELEGVMEVIDALAGPMQTPVGPR